MHLRRHEIDACGVSSFEEARQQLARGPWDMLLRDILLAGYNGLQLGVRARRLQPHVRVILLRNGGRLSR